MYNSYKQRYYNEHLHIPESFYHMPKVFMIRLLKQGSRFLSAAYNYTEAADGPTTGPYRQGQFKVRYFKSGDCTYCLCGWTEDHIHINIADIGCELAEIEDALIQALKDNSAVENCIPARNSGTLSAAI